MQYDDVITNPRWRTDAILEIVFWLYLGAILTDQREIWNGDKGSHADIGHVTSTAIFANSRWRTAAILKIALSPYVKPRIIRFRSNFVGRCTFQFPSWIFNKNPYFFKFKIADGRHIENRFFGYISAPYWPIKAKFGTEMKDYMPI